MANNPIELLISLAVNSARSKENVDDNIKALKKYYDKNPLLLNVDIDRSKALANIHKFVQEASKESIKLDVSLTGSSGQEVDSLKSKVASLKAEIEELKRVMAQPTGGGRGGSSKFFDLDIDKVLIQVDNLGRKGVVAASQVSRFQTELEALRGTNDRLSLKGITNDILNITSGAGHADKVIEGLSQSLIQIGASQQKLTSIRDKFDIDPKTSDEYRRLDGIIEKLTSDIIRMQTQASSGGADQIKLAGQMREVQQRIAEATREMNNFSTASKNENAFAKLQKDAENMVKELIRTGQVSNQVIGDFQRDMAVISSSSESSVSKINRLTQAMDRLKEHAGNVKMDNRFNDQIDSQALSIDKLEAKILRIGTIHKNTVDKMEFRRLTEEARRLAEQLQRVESGADLRNVTKRYKELSGEVDRLGANAVTAARASRGLVDTLGEAFRKFPVWAGMAALIYTPIRGIQDLIDKVVELDTALVQLQRVMDAPSYVFDEMIQSMIANVDALSGKTADYMQMVGDFARTGLDEDQSQEYANVATVLQNISELTPEETINVLTASMTAFGEETEGVLRIADRLNEIK